ncbi:MAG: cell division protein FtsZ [Hyphomicrobiaceae bacterium]|nr:cell division protein FtsZ [Hyphomicrobiaceae bacterium]
MSINLELPKLTELKPRIIVVGVGGAGGNAINNMIASGLTGVEYIAANTDAQALVGSSAERRIQLGASLTEGLGAGSKPEIGEAAAEEAIEDIRAQVAGAHMVFIAAGMGGGTGTGAAAVIARAARDMGVLAVGIVTKPFLFEGTRRMRTAEAGIAELRKYVDTLIVIPNQNLFRIATEKTTFAEAFVLADQVLYSGVACIVDLIVKDGLINLDFADVRTVMSGMGTAMMGTGEASGERRAMRAAEEAISNPLLDEVTLKGAKGLLLSIIGGRDMTLYEVDEAASRVRQEVDPDANIIVGATFDDQLGDHIRVAIVASGMNGSLRDEGHARPYAQPTGHSERGHGPAAAEPAVKHPSADAIPPPAPHGSKPAGAPPVAGWGLAGATAGTSGHPPPPASKPTTGALAAPSPPPASHAGETAPAEPRELWRGPNDVIIEESRPPRSQGPAGRSQPPPLAPAETPDPFKPGPPEELRRAAPRRLPDLEEFPAVGQREYLAKSGQYDEAGHRPPPPVHDSHGARDAGPRGGLLQRMMGGGRRHEAKTDDSGMQRRNDSGARTGGFFNKNSS